MQRQAIQKRNLVARRLMHKVVLFSLQILNLKVSSEGLYFLLASRMLWRSCLHFFLVQASILPTHMY